MTEPISVVITCYNLERYIGQAIRSVLEQDYEGEIQIIVVDDRSTDRSRDILSDTVGIETVLRKENGGGNAGDDLGVACRTARHGLLPRWRRHLAPREVDALYDANYIPDETVHPRFVVHGQYWADDCERKPGLRGAGSGRTVAPQCID